VAVQRLNDIVVPRVSPAIAARSVSGFRAMHLSGLVSGGDRGGRTDETDLAQGLGKAVVGAVLDLLLEQAQVIADQPDSLHAGSVA
jgi:hypothetical protein